MNSKNMEARREAFERWFTETYTAHKLSPRMTNCGIVTDGYQDSRVDLCWRGFNAALDSICVELPKFGYDYARNDGIAECQDALTAAGVAYKSS